MLDVTSLIAKNDSFEVDRLEDEEFIEFISLTSTFSLF
jgi:hypothetical protein